VDFAIAPSWQLEHVGVRRFQSVEGGEERTVPVAEVTHQKERCPKETGWIEKSSESSLEYEYIRNRESTSNIQLPIRRG
jgi:hypothetical protein